MTRNRNTRDNLNGESTSARSRDPKFPKPRYFTRNRSRRLAMLGGAQDGRRNQVPDQVHWDRMAVLRASHPGPGESLVVVKVDFNKETNAINHHTDKYELGELIVRRGQSWALTLEFERPIVLAADVITLQLAFGNQPKESKGTLLRVKLNFDGKEVFFSCRKWSAKVQEVISSKVIIGLTSPIDAYVGRYGLFIETQLKNNKNMRRYEVEDEDFILLFNPWNQQDVVYMSDELEREEYVLNEQGRIWVGSASNHHGRPWYFGQFDSPVLEAALTLMDEAEIGDSARDSPIVFVRALSALANSMDDRGVLEGRWTKEYPKDCTLPWTWTGSVKIIKAFMNNRKSVRFGQCWVFSGLMTSLLRAVGIPTRSVTNFESAHDTDSSMTIDSHFDVDGEPVPWMDDSVWNFHVWNESFFQRLDLPEGYGGWQAHDATPQELSEGIMRCGPAPVTAIKEGHVYLNYDVPFIFSEVNGDKVSWKVEKDGTMTFIGIDSRSVGKFISTKSVLSNWRQDITLQYKYPEGSDDERRVVEFVNRYSTRCSYDIYCNDIVKDVDFHLKLPESTMIGDTLKISVLLKSNSKETRSVQGRLTALGAFYTGVPGKRIKCEQFSVELSPAAEQELSVEATAEEYLPKLQAEASLQTYALFSVKETGQQFARNSAFTLLKPPLTIEIPDKIKAKERMTGTVKFTNELPVALTNGFINLDGSSIISMDIFNISYPIQPSHTVSVNFDFCPRRSGRQEIEATFTSDQLSGVDGSIEFTVSH